MPTWYGFGRSRSAHLFAQKSAYSGRSSSCPTSFSRLSGSVSTKNARVSSGVGKRPITSRYARRGNVESVADSDGVSPSCFSFSQTWPSMKLRRGSFTYTAGSTKPGRGINTRQTANLSTNRAVIAASPGMVPTWITPSGFTAVYPLSFDWNAASLVTSSVVPSEKWAVARSRCVCLNAATISVGDTVTRVSVGASFGVRAVPVATHRFRRSYPDEPFGSFFPPPCGTSPLAFNRNKLLSTSAGNSRRPRASFTMALWSKSGSNPSSDRANPFWPRALP